MLLFTLAIIYVACGAPVAVFSMAEGYEPRRERAVSAVGSLFLWPFMIFAQKPRVHLKRAEVRLTDAAARLERVVAGVASVPEFCEFRETLSHYRSLSVAGSSVSVRAALAVAEHPSPNVALACLGRKRRALIGSRLTETRSELVTLLLHLRSAEALAAAVEMADVYGDQELLRSLRPLVHNGSEASLSAAAA
jgi:hypothetical protein